jgi:hypothetical protein
MLKVKGQVVNQKYNKICLMLTDLTNKFVVFTYNFFTLWCFVIAIYQIQFNDYF